MALVYRGILASPFAQAVGRITAIMLAVSTVLVGAALLIGYTAPNHYLLFVGQTHSEWAEDVFLHDLDQAITRNLTHSQYVFDFDPMWSRDGARAAFRRGGSDVCVLETPGIHSHCLSLSAFENGVVDVFIIGWLAGSAHLALYVLDSTADVYFTVIDVQNGSLLRQRWERELHGTLYNRVGSLSPDGSTLLGVRFVAGDSQLIAAPIDDINAFTPLSPPEVDASYPSWSPDGSQIAYIGYSYSPARFDLFAVNADGSGERLIASDVSTVLPEIIWSTDGETVLFASNAGDGDFEVYAVDLGAAMVNPPRTLTDNGELDSNPQVSPDGEWIAYESAEDTRCGYTQLFLKRIDGTDKRQLTYGCGSYFNPVWQPQ